MNKYAFTLLIITSVFHYNGKLLANNYNLQLSLTKSDAVRLKDELYKNYSAFILSHRLQEMEDQMIQIDDKKMKFDIIFFGEKPQTGWKLYFSLHGGGSVADSVNENLWIRQKTLYNFKNGIAIVPRSPTNTWDMWHQEHIDIFFNRLIQNMINFHDVNPNEIYLMGRSAGGDGVYQLAPRMADRFAAAAMMAGHPNETSPIGLRNIGFTIQMGENDSAYNRNNIAKIWRLKLQELRKNDPNGYNHLVNIYENKGHWVDELDTSAILWITNFIRNPYPEKVVWLQDDVTHSRFYWLKIDNPLKNSLIIANIKNQTITIDSTTVSEFIIRLNDEIIDMDQNVIVRYLGDEIFNGMVPRDRTIMASSIEEYGDPESVFYGEIKISVILQNR